jgi:hypothetical protein
MCTVTTDYNAIQRKMQRLSGIDGRLSDDRKGCRY